jgi:hypothetical protein
VAARARKKKARGLIIYENGYANGNYFYPVSGGWHLAIPILDGERVSSLHLEPIIVWVKGEDGTYYPGTFPIRDVEIRVPSMWLISRPDGKFCTRDGVRVGGRDKAIKCFQKWYDSNWRVKCGD